MGSDIASGLKPKAFTRIFDCAFKPFKGERSLNYMAHLRIDGCGAAIFEWRDFEKR